MRATRAGWGVGPGPVGLGAGDCPAAQGEPAVCGAAAALGGRAHFWLVGTVPPVEQGLRGLTRQRGGKDYEALPASAEAWIHIAMLHLMLRPVATNLMGLLTQALRAFLSLDGAENIESLAVVADADLDRSRAEDRIHGALSAVDLPSPRRPLEMLTQDKVTRVLLGGSAWG